MPRVLSVKQQTSSSPRRGKANEITHRIRNMRKKENLATFHWRAAIAIEAHAHSAKLRGITWNARVFTLLIRQDSFHRVLDRLVASSTVCSETVLEVSDQ